MDALLPMDSKASAADIKVVVAVSKMPHSQTSSPSTVAEPLPASSELVSEVSEPGEPPGEKAPLQHEAENHSEVLQHQELPEEEEEAHLTAEAETQDYTEIPVDPDYAYPDDDAGSAYSDSLNGDDTCSLASYITKYRFENGRRYHAYRDGAYWAPNDDIQNDQQDIAHHLWLLTLDNQLFLSPIINPHNILDIGTGTGIWAIDVADLFPAAAITGTDLSPIQPNWVPSNCSFEVDDVNLSWTYRPASFDFIHVREMFGSVSNWDEFYSQALTALKPGAYLEHCEHSISPVSDDATVDPDHIYTQYGRVMNEMGRRKGKEFDIWKQVRSDMERAGFVDVVERRTKWPMCGWSSDRKMKELGRWNQLRVEWGIEGFAMRMLTHVGGWSYTEVQAFIGKIRAALRDRTCHGYLDVTVVYGRKPLDA